MENYQRMGLILPVVGDGFRFGSSPDLGFGRAVFHVELFAALRRLSVELDCPCSTWNKSGGAQWGRELIWVCSTWNTMNGGG